MAETTLTARQIMDLGLWNKVCEYKGWEYLSFDRVDENERITFDSEFKKEEVNKNNPFDLPQTLDELIESLEESVDRYDFSEDYIINNDLSYPTIGEFTYGTSYVPSYIVLPYLLKLKKLEKEFE